MVVVVEMLDSRGCQVAGSRHRLSLNSIITTPTYGHRARAAAVAQAALSSLRFRSRPPRPTRRSGRAVVSLLPPRQGLRITTRLPLDFIRNQLRGRPHQHIRPASTRMHLPRPETGQGRNPIVEPTRRASMERNLLLPCRRPQQPRRQVRFLWAFDRIQIEIISRHMQDRNRILWEEGTVVNLITSLSSPPASVRPVPRSILRGALERGRCSSTTHIRGAGPPHRWSLHHPLGEA